MSLSRNNFWYIKTRLNIAQVEKNAELVLKIIYNLRSLSVLYVYVRI